MEPARAPSSLTEAQRVLGYRTREALGEGSTAVVWAGTERVGERSVALKIARRRAHEPELFAELAVGWGLAPHPGLVRPTHVTRDNTGRLVLVADRAEGPTLDRWRPSLAAADAVALGLARALAALHACRRVHGDLSPANAIVTDPRAGAVRLIDLGAGEGEPGEGCRVTIAYAAPERLRGAAATAAGDRYALGALLHRVYVGQPPFGGLDAAARVDAALTRDPRVRLDGRSALAALIERLLQREPLERFPSTDAVVAELERILGAPPSRPPAPGLRGLTDWLVAAPALGPLTRGAALRVEGPPGAGRGRAAAELLRRAVAAGSRALTLEVSAERGSFDALRGALALAPEARPDQALEALLSAASDRPLAVLLDAPDEDAAARAQTLEVLYAATRLGAVRALVTAAPDEPTAPGVDRWRAPPLSPDLRRAALAATLDAPGDVVEAIDAALAASQVAGVGHLEASLRALASTGLLARRGGRWSVDHERLAREAPAAIRAAADPIGLALAALPRRAREVLAALAVLDGRATRVELATLLEAGPRATGAADLHGPRCAAAAVRRHARPGAARGDLEQSRAGHARAPTARAEARPGPAPAPDARPDAHAADSIDAALTALARAERIELNGGVVVLRAARLGTRAAEALSPEGRRALHAAALTCRGDDAQAALWHAAHAGRACAVDDLAAAVERLVAGGQSGRARALLECAGDRLAADERARLAAEVHLARAEAEAARSVLEAALTAHPTPRLAEALGAALVRAGEHEAALAHFGAHPPQSPHGALWAARARLWTGDLEGAEAAGAALTDDAGVDERVRAGALHLRATAAWQQGRLEQAGALAEAALALPAARDAALRADLLRSKGAVAAYAGDPAAAEAALSEAVAINRRLGRVPELGKSLNNLTMARHGTGDWPGARAACEEFRMLCARTGDPVEMANASNNLGFIELRIGEPLSAAQRFREALRLAATANYTRIEPVALGNLGEALLRAGQLEEAEAPLLQSLAQLEALGAHQDRTEALRRLAERSLALGRIDEAVRRSRALLDDPGLAEVPLEAAHARRLLALALAARGESEAAREEADRAVNGFARHGGPYERALGLLARGAALLACGETDEAEREAEAAELTLVRLGARLDAAEARALRDEARRASSRLARRASRGDLLTELGLRFGRTLELDALAPLVLERLSERFGADRGVVALFAPDGSVERAVTRGLTWAGPHEPLPISTGLLAELRRTRRPVVVRDTLQDNAYGERASVLLLGLRSLVGVPIVADEGVVGAIYLDSRRPVEAFEEELELLTSLSRFVGMAVQNARLYEEQRYRARLLATMVHDFRAPLAAISANADALGHGALPIWELAEIGDEVGASADRMRAMIDRTLELSRIEEGAAREPAAAVDVAAVLGGQVRGLESVARVRGLRFVVEVEPRLPTACTVADRVRVVLDNLLFNALKHASTEAPVRVRLRRRADAGPESAARRSRGAATVHFRRARPLRPAQGEGFVEIEIANAGAPIAPDRLDALFMAYERGDGEGGDHKSTGLGLSIVDELVRHLGGRVWVTSDAAATRFIFTLPTAVAAD